jgi:hypothetical protein
VRVVLAAPPRATTETELLPGYLERLAALERVRGQENGLDGDQTEDEGGIAAAAAAQQYRQSQQVGRSSWELPEGGVAGSVNGSSFEANLFGPRVEVAWLLDPYGSMAAGPSSAHSGTALLQQLLSKCSLQLAPRPDPAVALLPDPAEEGLADTRAPTWREAIEARERRGGVASTATKQQDWTPWRAQQHQQKQGEDEPQQQQQQHQHLQEEVQPPWQQGLRELHANAPPPWQLADAGTLVHGVEDAVWDEGGSGDVGLGHSADWITMVPAAPRRDDTAEAEFQGKISTGSTAGWGGH